MRTHTPLQRAEFCRDCAYQWHRQGRDDLARPWIHQMDRWLAIAADALVNEIEMNTR
jgi:hypothetical protein